jgi:hypothetical protein
MQYKSYPRRHLQLGSWIFWVAHGALSYVQGAFLSCISFGFCLVASRVTALTTETQHRTPFSFFYSLKCCSILLVLLLLCYSILRTVMVVE